MNIHDVLLKTLGGANAPTSKGASTPAGETPQTSFSDLLSKAEKGDLESGLSISVAPSVGVQFSHDQLGRLARAADRASAAGMEHALVIIDGAAFVMDVHGRTITRSVRPDETTLTGIDGLVNASVGAEEAAKAGAGSTAPGPGAAYLKNASLLAYLSGRKGEEETQTVPV